MAWNGYFKYAGNEFINLPRTEVYARDSIWFRPSHEGEDLPLLTGDGSYHTPMVDVAPWTDPDVPTSYDFWGYYPLDITGIEDATVTSTVVESTGDGGVPGRVRRGTKSVVFNGLLLAADDCGADYGMKWLRNVLIGNPCTGNAATLTCNGDDLCYLTCEPALGDVDPSVTSPEGVLRATNNVFDPSTNDGTLGPWTAYGVNTTATSEIDENRRAIKTIKTALANSLGVSTTGITPRPTGTQVTLSAWVKNPVGSTTTSMGFILRDDTNNDSSIGTGITAGMLAWTVPADGQYHRIYVTCSIKAARTLQRIYVLKAVANLPAGETLYIRDVMLTDGPTLHTAFAGDTPDGAGFDYDWLGTPYASASTKTEYSMVTAQNCLDQMTRSLRRVVFNTGPTVTAKQRLSDGGSAWMVTFTGIAGNPYEFGQERPVVVGFMDPLVTDPYPPGMAGSFDLNGVIKDETQCAYPVQAPVFDPLCPALVVPPSVPNVPLGCFNPQQNWRRRQFTIPNTMITLYSDAVPYVRVYARNGDCRNLRLRFYSDVEGNGSIEDDVCAHCGDILISYIPDDMTLVFDGSEETVWIESPGGARRRADNLVFATDGGPFEWPALSCGFGYIVTVDLPQTQTPPVLDFSIYNRVA